ncbi:hypothetical protein [Haloarcula sediminis]|uniref:hypothetical protein n=1 Tax=Haloarcula sediminis TaxID=3111777 RepID=UPI002D79EB8C|nr:hypothetical protein [Haloarcula sp. CK38]
MKSSSKPPSTTFAGAFDTREIQRSVSKLQSQKQDISEAVSAHVPLIHGAFDLDAPPTICVNKDEVVVYTRNIQASRVTFGNCLLIGAHIYEVVVTNRWFDIRVFEFNRGVTGGRPIGIKRFVFARLSDWPACFAHGDAHGTPIRNGIIDERGVIADELRRAVGAVTINFEVADEDASPVKIISELDAPESMVVFASSLL